MYMNVDNKHSSLIPAGKGQNPLHQFPRSKSTTSTQHKRQVRNKLARAKVRCRVVSQIPLQRLVADLLAVTSP